MEGDASFERTQEQLPMTILGTIPNLDASVSWWTSVEAARYFWLVFAIVAVGVFFALSRRRRRPTSGRR
jgi:hypothetical protein